MNYLDNELLEHLLGHENELLGHENELLEINELLV